MVQMRLETKRNKKARSLPHINEVMVLHHNMVLPQMVSPGANRSPSDATAFVMSQNFEMQGCQRYGVKRIKSYFCE